MTKETDIEEADPVIAKLQKTGCLEKHYAVLVSASFFLRGSVINPLYSNMLVLGMLGQA